LSKEVKAILNLRDPGFVWRKYQSSFLQECFNEGFDLRLQQLFGATRDNEVITVAHQVHLDSSTQIARFRVLLPELLLSSV